MSLKTTEPRCPSYPCGRFLLERTHGTKEKSHWKGRGEDGSAERVAMLKREGRHRDVIPILSEWLDETEKDPLGVSAWPYQQLAIIHRKLRDPAREVEVLERFARQRHLPDARSLKLFQRLVRAYELQGELEEGTLEGRPVPVHRSHGMPVDAVPSFRSTGLVLDVETTGLSREDELIEFGGVLFSFSRLSGRVLSELDRYQGMREPGRPIHPGAARAHGLTPIPRPSWMTS